MLDSQGRITTWNQGGRRLKGYESDEVVGRHFSLFYTPEDVAAGKPARELEAAQSEGKYEEEGERVRKDGSRFWASVLITPLRDEQGRLRGFSKVIRDITERKRADEALRESKERLAAVMENLSEGLIMADDQGRVIYWNPAALAMFGYASMDECRRELAEFADTFEVRPLNEDGPVPVEDWPMSRVLRGEGHRSAERRVGT